MCHIPPLNSYIQELPKDPTCIYIHDVGIMSEYRGCNYPLNYLNYIIDLALSMNINILSFVSVYGMEKAWKKFGFDSYNDYDVKSQLSSYGPKAVYMQRTL